MPTATRLEKGQFAPSINTKTIFERVVNIEAMTDHKIWVAFYRYATCPLCELHFDDVLGQIKQLEEWDIKFIAVFESEIKNFPKRIQKMNEDELFIIADKQKFLYDAYGIEVSWPKVFHPGNVVKAAQAAKRGFRKPKLDGNLATIPAHFLIAPGGQVFETHYGKSAGHHIGWDRIKNFAETKFAGLEIQLDEIELEDQ